MMSTGLADILQRIVTFRRQQLKEARESENYVPPTGEPVVQYPGNNPFLAALAEKRGRAVIAEIKMGSPSLGSLVDRFEPLKMARMYAAGGAAALSVVVEPDFFYGSYELLAACHEASGLPTIAKDFIVDPLQLRWAKRAGASAILLIAALYTKEELIEYAHLARSFGLAPLIETHDLADLMKLGGEIWELVGVNNRNLRTFSVELSTSLALLPSLPTGALKVTESGLESAADVAMLRGMGYDAYLIGEALLTADNPGDKLRELCG